MHSLVHDGYNYWHPIIATSFSQDNSSRVSPIMPEEFGEHLTRDQRPFLHTESLQILHNTSPAQVTSQPWQKLLFVLVCFELLSWWKIQPRPFIIFLTEAVGLRFFNCWYLIESMMPCIWSRCPGSPAEKQAHNIKDAAVYLIMGYFYPCLY